MEAFGSLKGFEILIISLGGIFCLYLSYRLLKTGTSQPFPIFSDLKGWKFKAANLAPSAYFAILGAVIICSPVISNVIAILQKETFINTYATKLVLEELRKKNEQILTYELENPESLKDSRRRVLSTKGDLLPTKLRESYKAVVTVDRLRLRKNPGTNYRVISSLRKGEVITVKEAGGRWLRVSTDEIADGWVHGDYVRRLKSSGTKDAAKTALLLISN